MAPDLPPVLDEDAVPEPLRLSEERLRELVGDADPGFLGRYLDLLARRREDRCRAAAVGVGGLYWPCVRPAVPGDRYCFAHRDAGGL